MSRRPACIVVYCLLQQAAPSVAGSEGRAFAASSLQSSIVVDIHYLMSASHGAKRGLYSSTGYWVTRLSRAMESDLERRLAAHGVSRAMWALLWAVHSNGQSTPSALSSFVGIDRAAVTRHVERLVEMGLLSRAPDPDDRRRIQLALTPRGKRLTRKLSAASKTTNEKFTKGLRPAETRALRETIRKMLSNRERLLGDL